MNVFAGTTGKIAGQVTDGFGAPLPGATIILDGDRRGTETDEEGIYFLLSVEPGRYVLSAHMIGYETVQRTEVLVTSDFTTNLSFALKEKALALDEIVVEAQAGSGGWGMMSGRAATPPVEPDRTTSKYLIRAGDFEALSIMRDLDGFLELQAGITVDEEGNEFSIRAGDTGDVGYYLDGIPLPQNDHIKSRAFSDFNRLAVQEMTVITGGMDAEYGNAQGGVVSVIIRQGQGNLSGLVDYELTPPGKKHWGPNVYDSAMLRGQARWDDPAWVSETVRLSDDRVIRAHNRADYTDIIGHHIEGNLSGMLASDFAFFLSGRLKRDVPVFPTANLDRSFDRNMLGKLTWQPNQAVKLDVGLLADQRVNDYIPELYIRDKDVGNRTFVNRLLGALRADLGEGGRHVFATSSNLAGDTKDSDLLAYTTFTHIISPRTFYEIKIARSLSKRDTLNTITPLNIQHISEATSSAVIYDAANFFPVYQDVVAWERFRRDRYIFQSSLSSQVTRGNFVKAGFEFIRYNNWYQRYGSEGPHSRTVAWYGRSYEDSDFFPGKENKGVNPYQYSLHVQDKLELGGMVINAGLRYDRLVQNAWVTDLHGFMGADSPMWHSMTRARGIPTIKGPSISSLNHRIGVSHPLSTQSVLRFFYGKYSQFPDFKHLFFNAWNFTKSETDSDIPFDGDLNGNGALDPSERWNAYRPGVGTNRGLEGVFHNSFLKPEETISFEVGFDWQFVSDYVLSLTTYYKSANNQILPASQQWSDPERLDYVVGAYSFANGIFKDVRGVELNLKKRFSDMFALNFALNLQWADEGSSASIRRDVIPDSLFVANGHYWVDWDVDPATGAEIPVSLTEKAIREGRDPDYYIRLYGGYVNGEIKALQQKYSADSPWSWGSVYSHYAAEGISFYAGEVDTKHYRQADKEFWRRINNEPGYPGFAEGNLLVSLSQEGEERRSHVRDSQAALYRHF
ncbi:MAG: TonB-dependent receptor [Candidatus Latescibacteria bacterium]|nr:TonB-dependent receptor [Candidatus Latescibacterota bacterium]